MTLYRYQLKESKEGILVSLDDYFDADDIFTLAWIFECKLDAANIDMSKTISYFTQKGNRKFHKAVSKIVKSFEAIGVEVEKVEIDFEDVKDSVAYMDNLQVICKVA